MDLEKMKEENTTDNTRLEELTRSEITPEMQREFLDLLKESQLLMPVTFSQNVFEGLENAKVGDEIAPQGQIGFSINYLEDNEGNRVVPLYTSDKAMEEAGVRSSVYALYMSDLADMLKQTDKYSVISINPFTDHDINMPIQAFLGLFEEENDLMETLNTMLKILEEKSQTLEEDYAFFVRESVDFMKENAVDGVFTPNIPFNASTRKDFHGDKKYLNVLLMPKTSKILYIGDIVGEDGYDIVIAPDTEFHHVEDVDEYTRVWKCGAQPFYDD
jgi:hypothetical protein